MTRSIIHTLRRRLVGFGKDADGAVAIEFALIAPLFFALLFGVVTLGFFIGVSHSVQQLANGAARVSVAGLDSIERQTLADAYLDQAETRYPLLTDDALTTVLAYSETPGPEMSVSVTYAAEGTLLDVANGFLGLDISTIKGSAHIAY